VNEIEVMEWTIKEQKKKVEQLIATHNYIGHEVKILSKLCLRLAQMRSLTTIGAKLGKFGD
jgi:hypothetical protein